MIEIKMRLGTLLILFFNVPLVLMLTFEAPVPEKLWSERCFKNMIALNDCNWCRCNAKSTYTCNARACREVDMFGHFNDAIREMDVGMEGRGSWRSDDGACEPGVHYRKDDLLCVCSEDGKWPNPVCRDIFQILHSVVTTEHKEPVENKSCSASKLYLFGCNVCFCPSSGEIDPHLCTNKTCEDDNVGRTHSKEENTAEEIYATCIPNKSYKIGCQTCMCLRNNRLLCDNCSAQVDHKRLTGHKTECHLKKPGDVFKKDCNFCHCDKNETLYCTVKNCLENHTEISLPKGKYAHAGNIENEQNCVPNSKFKKDCNTCYCFVEDGVKYFGCTLKTCKLTTDISFDTSCVEGTSYQLNCMICHCVVDEGIKREYCTIDDTCEEETTLPRKLSSMHGYCEPMHVYQQDCNQCRCLADGKTVACTSKICSKRKERKKNSLLKDFRAELEANIEQEPPTDDNALVMEFIPFVQRGNICPIGQMYMVGCNMCYCLNTGNAVCTTKKC